MKKKHLISILVMIQFAGLIQIGWAAFVPGYWRMSKSDQEKVIREGGDNAVEVWRRSEEQEASHARIWGIGLGVSVLALASLAVMVDSRGKPR